MHGEVHKQLPIPIRRSSGIDRYSNHEINPPARAHGAHKHIQTDCKLNEEHSQHLSSGIGDEQPSLYVNLRKGKIDMRVAGLTIEEMGSMIKDALSRDPVSVARMPVSGTTQNSCHEFSHVLHILNGGILPNVNRFRQEQIGPMQGMHPAQQVKHGLVEIFEGSSKVNKIEFSIHDPESEIMLE